MSLESIPWNRFCELIECRTSGVPDVGSERQSTASRAL